MTPSALTDRMRAPEWGFAPIAPAPAWARTLWGVESSATTPVVVRQSLTTLAAFFEQIASAKSDRKSLYAVPDLYLAASPESKTKLLTGYKAAPFAEPAVGLVYLRNRWYDPSTGTFLTPDPMGYQDSSNLYAFCGNDPVNASDPRGEELTYAAWVGINTVADTAIDLAIHSWADVYYSRDTKFNWGESFTTNLAVNAITGGVGAKLKYFKYLKNPVARFLATEGAEYAFDVAATGTVDVVLNDQSPREAYGSAALGGLVGRGISHGVSATLRRFSRRSGYIPLTPLHDDPGLRFGDRFDNAVAEAGMPPLPSGWQRHHTVQQRMAQQTHPFHYLAAGRDVHEPALIRGALAQKQSLTVTDPTTGRVRNTHPHAEMDREIRAFLQTNPTRRQYDEYLDYLDWRWLHTYWEMGAGR